MPEVKVRISELPLSQSTTGLTTIGVNLDGESVKVPLGSILQSQQEAISQILPDIHPIVEVEDEDAMAQMIANGETDSKTLYYIPE